MSANPTATTNDSVRLDDIAHRDFAPPQRTWVMSQRWNDLLFAHWPVSPEILRPLIPPQLTLDTWEGQAWVGVVPFTMSHVHWRYLPPLPGMSAFPELNVRTYVTYGDKPGVWFFSLDADSRLSVEGARAFFRLPYLKADMTSRLQGDSVNYESHRTDKRGNPAEFQAQYRPIGAASIAQRGTHEYWLTERYCMYTADSARKLYRGDIHHPAWSLQPAKADISVNTMAQAAGIALPQTAPLLHFAKRQDMLGWWLSPL
ncbi:MAG: DUF2071 domain-containing protein [Burkholderiales bacterium]|nr:DUF2071 domain-containing protein [Anaerolineae bacterium]